MWLECNYMFIRAKDILNKQFGNLTVIERIKRQPKQVSSAAYWLCRCVCGNTIIACGAGLRSGQIFRCRKCRYKAASNSKIKDLTGQKFNRLTVLGLYEIRCRRSIWLCQCTCGKQVRATSYSLKEGTTKSCGCWNKDRLRQEMIEKRFNSEVTISSLSSKLFLDKLENYLNTPIEREFFISNRFFDGRIKNVLIEIDSKYWHSTSKQKEIDNQKEQIAKQHGFLLFRFNVNSTRDVDKKFSSYKNTISELKRLV